MPVVAESAGQGALLVLALRVLSERLLVHVSKALLDDVLHLLLHFFLQLHQLLDVVFSLLTFEQDANDLKEKSLKQVLLAVWKI